MQKALEALRSAGYSDSIDDDASTSGSSSTGPGTALSALKDIKHALIGNTSRKLELAKSPEDVKR